MVASRQLALRGVPSLRIVQRSPYTVRTGDPIRLDCLAMSVGADGLLLGLSQSATTSGHMLRWSKQGQAITSYSSQDVHGSTRSLIIQRVAPSDAGHYVCSCCTLPKGQQSQGELPEGVEPRERNVVEESVLVIGTPDIYLAPLRAHFHPIEEKSPTESNDQLIDKGPP